MKLDEAINRFVHDGDHVRIGGHGGGRPYCSVFEIIRQKRQHLTISGMGMWQELDLLVGIGAVDKYECSWVGLEASLAPSIRRAIEKNIPHKVEFEDYSHLAMNMRSMAGAMGLPFMPIRSLLGSDLGRVGLEKGFLKEIQCPFTGEKLMAVKALRPDVALLHAQKADKYGNVLYWGYYGDDEWGMKSADHVIITVEEIVGTEEIKHDPNRVLIPSFMVDAVCQVPYGSHPWGVTGYYKTDQAFIGEYLKAAKDYAMLMAFVKEWIIDTPDRNAYMKKLGTERLAALQVEEALSNPVGYGS